MWLTDQQFRSDPGEVLDARNARSPKGNTSTSHDPEPSPQQIEDRITANSPEGRPEHSQIGGRYLLWLVVAPFAAIAVLAAVVFFIWGLAAAALVFVFGVALATLANPEVWATFLRAQEREQSEHPIRPDEENAI